MSNRIQGMVLVALCLLMTAGGSAVIAQTATGGDKAGASGPLQVPGTTVAKAATKIVLPAYPDELRSGGVEGAVVVKVSISRDGIVTKAEAILGAERLRPVAATAAGAWTFQRLLKDSVAVEAESSIAFLFSAKDGRISTDGPEGVYSGPLGAVVEIVGGKMTPAASAGGVGVDATAQPVHTRAVPRKIRVSGGVLAGRAVERFHPRGYPDAAKRLGIQGSVDVEIQVSEAGRVLSAKAVSGPLELRDAAVEAARLWTFEPMTAGGFPVQVIGTLTFHFKNRP
jgi:TonB family protein